MNPLVVEGCRQRGMLGAVMDEEAPDDPGARSQARDRPRDRNGSPEPAARAPRAKTKARPGEPTSRTPQSRAARGTSNARSVGRGAEDGGGDAQPGGGAGVAGLVVGVGDLAGDGAELGGDRGLAGGHAFEGVEDLVVLAAARGEHGDEPLGGCGPRGPIRDRHSTGNSRAEKRRLSSSKSAWSSRRRRGRRRDGARAACGRAGAGDRTEAGAGATKCGRRTDR